MGLVCESGRVEGRLAFATEPERGFEKKPWVRTQIELPVDFDTFRLAGFLPTGDVDLNGDGFPDEDWWGAGSALGNAGVLISPQRPGSAPDSPAVLAYDSNNVDLVTGAFGGDEHNDITQFVHQFDQGLAPSVHFGYFLDQAEMNDASFANKETRYIYLLNGLRLKQAVGSLSEDDVAAIDRLLAPATNPTATGP